MSSLETKALASFEHTTSLYKRYIDDMFVIWRHGRELFDRFNISMFNTLTSSSQLTILIHPRAVLVFLILLSLLVVVYWIGSCSLRPLMVVSICPFCCPFHWQRSGQLLKTSLLGHWRCQHRKGESGMEKICQLIMSKDYPAREIEAS